MADAVDISDLPAPDADISDLPAPPASAPTAGQEIVGGAQAAGAAAMNAVAPLGAITEFTAKDTLNRLLHGGNISSDEYNKIKQKWAVQPDNPIAQRDLAALGNLPVIKQLGQLFQGAGKLIETGTGGKLSADQATDMLNSAVMGIMRPDGVGRATTTDTAATQGGVSAFRNIANYNSPINQKVANTVVANQIGEAGVTKLTPAVLRAADDRIGENLDIARDPNKLFVAPAGELSTKLQELNEQLTPGDDTLIKSGPVRTLLDRLKQTSIQQPATGDLQHATDFGMRTPAGPNMSMLTGEDLGAASSELGKRGKTAANAGKYDEAQAFFQAKDSVEDIISKGLSPDEQAIYNTARAQYRTLWGQLLARGSSHLADGNVNILALGRYLARTDPSGYMLGKNTTPMYQLARVAEQQLGASTLMETTRQAGEFVPKVGAVMRAARAVGYPAQWVSQVGVNKAITALRSKPGFTYSLLNELQQPNGEDNNQ